MIIKKIAVVNESDASHDRCSKFTEACALQVAAHAGPAWDWQPIPISYQYDRPWEDAEKEGYFPIRILQSALSLGLTGELGDHDQRWGRVFVDETKESSWNGIEGQSGLSSVLSHEILETLGDPNIDSTRLNPLSNLEWMLELCDAVESQAYVVQVGLESIWVSDFVLPAFFKANAKENTDFLGLIKTPFTLFDKDCYTITRNPATGEWSQIPAPRRGSGKDHWSSRSQRRLAKLEHALTRRKVSR